jgi:hypothetical protein
MVSRRDPALTRRQGLWDVYMGLSFASNHTWTFLLKVVLVTAGATRALRRHTGTASDFRPGPMTGRRHACEGA